MDWSELQSDMLELIAEKCLSGDLKTFVMFSSVCCSWHRACSFVKSRVVLQQQKPWLMLPNDYGRKEDGDGEKEKEGEDDSNSKKRNLLYLSNYGRKVDGDGEKEKKEGVDDSNSEKRNLFDLGNSNWYSVRLPEASRRRCYGTGSEWVLTVGLDRQIQLLNPLTGASLPLPSYRSFLHQPHVDFVSELDEDQKAAAIATEEYYRNNPSFLAPEIPWDDNELFRFFYVKTALVVHLPPQQPNSNSNLLVVVIYDHEDYVAVAVPGDSEWTPVTDVENVCHAAYSPTLGILLFLTFKGQVRCCYLHHHNHNDNDNDNVASSLNLKVVDYAPLPPPTFHSFHKRYLLESFGDILLVGREFDEEKKVTCFFEVYKLDLQTKEWTELLDIGDVALFVGNGPAISVKASTHPSPNPNFIYFNDDGFHDCLWGPDYDDNGRLIGFTPGGSDMGVYDYDEGTIEPFYPADRDDYLSMYSVPIWFTPKL